MLTEAEKQTLVLLADSGLNISRAAETIGLSRKSVYDRLRNIENKTGIDPTDFWGLHKLLALTAQDDAQDDFEGDGEIFYGNETDSF
jgi:DNA-binding PucR family transcriptional regulator